MVVSMKKINTKTLSDNKGVTGVDLVIAIIVIAIFTGVVTQLMTSIYKMSIDIQKSANANAYATMILEKVDEKSFEEVTDNFVDNLKNNGEVNIDDDYTITMNITAIDGIDATLMKKVALKVEYNINGEKKQLFINKLKIKEIYNNG